MVAAHSAAKRTLGLRAPNLGRGRGSDPTGPLGKGRSSIALAVARCGPAATGATRLAGIIAESSRVGRQANQESALQAESFSLVSVLDAETPTEQALVCWRSL